MLALVGSGLILVTRSDDEPAVPQAEPSTPDVDLAPSGIVVSLTRAGDLPVPVDETLDFLVGATATEPVARLELWDGDTVVASYEPPGARSSLEPRLQWTPTETGRRLITARAEDAAGRVGLSNPVWVEVTDAPAITAYTAGAPAGFVPPVGLEQEREPAPAVVPAGGRGVRAATQVSAELPEVVVVSDGCDLEVTASPPASGPVQLVLLTVPPDGQAAVPVADLGVVEVGQSAEVTTGAGGGAQAFLVAAVSDGAVIGWSPPAVAEPDLDCPPPGWEGDLLLVDGKLHADSSAPEAYLYLEPEPGVWTRVPATGTVPKLGGTYDFGPFLPALPGSFEVHAWGRDGNDVSLIGTGTYVPPAAGGSATFGGGVGVLPPTTLRYVKPAQDDHPTQLLTKSTIDVDPDDDLLGTHLFTWSTPMGSASHGLVQVSNEPLPPGAGPGSFLSQFTCLVPGDGGLVSIDFDDDTCSPSLEPANVTLGSSYGNLVPVDLAGDAGQPNVGTKDPLAELEGLIDDDPVAEDVYGPEDAPPGEIPAWIEQRVIRVLPMTGSSWSGVRSNDVALEVDRTPKVPPGEYAYDLDLKLVTAPRPPNWSLMSCWQFTGWEDDAEAAALAAQEKQQLLDTYEGGLAPPILFLTQYPHLFWSTMTQQPGPICGGCYYLSVPGVGGATFGIGGADCSEDSSFWEDPIGWIGTNFVGPIVAVITEVVNLAADGFAYLKSQAVEGLMTITGCTGAFCELMANAVVNGALLALGVPPTIPNFDQLVALGKGELVDVAVGLAKDAGVPCDEAGAVASVTDQDDLTCEALVSQMLDELTSAVNESYIAAAQAGGLSFPADMHVVPFSLGQPGPATVEVTVTPTKYTAEEKGETCTAGVLTASSWTAPSTTYVDGELGEVTIPQTAWAGQSYEVAYWGLPALPAAPTAEHDYAPVVKTFMVAPPKSYDLVTVYKDFGLGGVVPYKLSRHAFLFHQGATFQIHVGGSCARSETHTYTLNGTPQAQLVSVVEG